MKRTQSVSNSVIHPSSLQHSFVITNAVTTVAHAPITARVRLRRPFNKVQFFDLAVMRGSNLAYSNR
jgi:hypothetical protein